MTCLTNEMELSENLAKELSIILLGSDFGRPEKIKENKYLEGEIVSFYELLYRDHKQIKQVRVIVGGATYDFITPSICQVFERMLGDWEKGARAALKDSENDNWGTLVQSSVFGGNKVSIGDNVSLALNHFIPDYSGLRTHPASHIFLFLDEYSKTLKKPIKQNRKLILTYRIMEILGIVKSITKGDIKKAMASYVRKYVKPILGKTQ